ncbi:LPD38 domain-containing protein [Pseudovibrio sp. POLY-S9]|uniref:LPD38 domain-containing protein n=1 Tax=Pseudovibrio sp. POLY-S9 TaxID=1576596 RepID=UPI00070DACC0|nr:LPD38 domain-containing protein [Pseudovibrio sp. POLY-S9]
MDDNLISSETIPENPFAALADAPGSSLMQGPRRSLGERFAINYEAAQRYYTLHGALKDTTRPADRMAFNQDYADFEDWDGFLEGATALTGQLSGTAVAVENFIGLGLGAKAIQQLGLTGLRARIFAGAVDAGAANLVLDSAIQGIEMGAGFREKIDPVQLAASTALGAAVGGAAGPLTHKGRGSDLAGTLEESIENAELKPQVPIDNAIREPVGDNPSGQAPLELTIYKKDVIDNRPAAESAETANSRIETGFAALEKNEAPAEPVSRGVNVEASDALPEQTTEQRISQAFEVFEREPGSEEVSGNLLADAGDEIKGMVGRSGKDELLEDVAKPDLASNVVEEVEALGDRLSRDAGLLPQRRGEQSSKGKFAAQQKEVTSASQKETLDAEGKSTGDVKPRLQGAEGQLARPKDGIAHSQTGDAAAPFTRLRDVSNRLADLAGIAAARQKRFSLKGSKSSRIMGTYGVRSGVVRIRSQDDFDTFSHEVGHHIEERLGKPIVALMKRHYREVEALAYPGVAPDNKLTEGFAEFFRLAMTNPRYVETNAQKFFKEFRGLLQKDDPELLKGLDEVVDAYSQYLQMPSQQAVETSIVSNKALGTGQKFASEAKRYGLGATIADNLHNAYTGLLDDFHPIHRAVRELARIHKARTGKVLDLKVKDDAGKLADMARGSQQSGHMDLMYGVHGYESLKPESASLRDAIVEAHGPGRNAFSSFDEAVMKKFGAYLWSRRAIFEWERYKKGEIPNPPDKLSLGDHLQNIHEAEAANPQWPSAAAKVYEFNQALWKKKLDAGLIAQETYQAGLKIRDYVPGLRAFDYDGDPAAKANARGGKSAAGSSMGSQHFKGSTRDVINPLETLMADAYETNAAIARNEPIKALAKLARRVGNGAGRIAEIVPAHDLKAMIVDPLEALKSAGRSVGLMPEEITLMTDSFEGLLGDSKATLFRPSVTNTKGESILFFRSGGQVQALRLADGEFGNQLMASFGMLAPVEHHMLIRMMGASASVLRAGITTTPEFILANGARDLMTSFVYYDEPFKVLKNIGKGVGDEVFNRQAAKEYNSLGGIMGGANAASVREGALKRDLEGLRKKGWKGRRVPKLKSVLEFTELSETGVRVGLMRTFKEQAQARGLTEIEAAYEAVWRSRDHINFDRRGSQMVALNRLIPFFNASLQGLDKFSRHMVLPYVKKLQGDVLTTADEAALGTAQKAWVKLSGVVLAGMGLYALMSQHSEFEEISDTTRATHWMVKTGDKWIAVPKPYELAVFVNIGEAAYDAFAKGDPLAAERYLSNLTTVLLPPSVMEGNPIVKTYFELKSNQDFFTGQQIVSDQLQALEPALQYTARTRAFSKQLGEALGWSPLITEKVFTNAFGGWGRNLAALYDYTDETALGQSPDDAPFLRRFVKDASKGSNSVSKFWDLVSPSTGQFERAALSFRALADGGDDVAADEYLNSLDSERRAYVTLAMMPAGTRRLHPLERARSAVRAIGALRRELTGPYITNAFAQENMREISAGDRGAADDILADLAMAETRNALIALGVPGWAHQKAIDTRTYHIELQELSPVLAKALADRFATRKVLPLGTVLERWPELRERVLMDGSGAVTVDLEASAEAAGFELGGFKIPRKEKPEVKGRR